MPPTLLSQYNFLLSTYPPNSTVFTKGKRKRINKNVRDQYLYTTNKRKITIILTSYKAEYTEESTKRDTGPFIVLKGETHLGYNN